MGNIHLIGSCFVVFVWLCLACPSHCQIRAFPVEISPQQSVQNGTVILTCLAAGFAPNVHMFTWKRPTNSPFLNVTADDRISVSPAYLIAETLELYSQSLTITNLTTSDAGSYMCLIIVKNSGIDVGNGEGRLTVNSTEEFPVCFPDGPAVVNEGDFLKCRTVIDERSAVVSDTENPIERPDWINASLAVNETGSQLQKSAIVLDNGVTFFCFSVTPRNQKWASLTCKIGPLTVIPGPLTTPTTPWTVFSDEPGLSVGVIIGLTVGLVLVILATLLVLYIVYLRQRRSNTTSSTGTNQQNPPHVYATAILEDTQTSSTADAELHNYANVNSSTANHGGAHEDLSCPEPSPNTFSNQKAVIGVTNPYMELSPQEPKHDVYTELKL